VNVQATSSDPGKVPATGDSAGLLATTGALALLLSGLLLTIHARQRRRNQS
jgi:hypothetical protein